MDMINVVKQNKVSFWNIKAISDSIPIFVLAVMWRSAIIWEIKTHQLTTIHIKT